MSAQIKQKPGQAAKKATAAVEKKTAVKLPFVFSRMNYILTAASLLVLVIGFILMSGSKGDIYDTRRITIAPIVVIIGFLMGFVAIFYREKSGSSGNDQTQA
jgi:uncharacterized membrane protein YozB (DUF420 family)